MNVYWTVQCFSRMITIHGVIREEHQKQEYQHHDLGSLRRGITVRFKIV